MEFKSSMKASMFAAALLVGLAGGSMLVWWAMVFHRHNQQLWMVPLGLIMLGTPMVIWFVLLASNTWSKVALLLAEQEGHPLPREHSPPPDLEK